MKNAFSFIKLFLCVLFLFAFEITKSQNSGITYALSNNVTSLPVVGYPQVFYSQCHPGFEVSRYWKINKSYKNRFYFNANAGFYYHRFVQTLIWIYPSVNYELLMSKRYAMSLGLGAGYAFSIEGSDVFKLNSDGKYEKKNVLAGRSQFIAQVELGGRYALYKEKPDGVKLILQLKAYLQGTYAKTYVPVLPLNSILIGVSIPLKSK